MSDQQKGPPDKATPKQQGERANIVPATSAAKLDALGKVNVTAPLDHMENHAHEYLRIKALKGAPMPSGRKFRRRFERDLAREEKLFAKQAKKGGAS